MRSDIVFGDEPSPMIQNKPNNSGKNRQLAINMIASMITFVIGLCIKFFLTPFVVKSLGADAYGFIGLSTDIIGYTTLVTIALNSMAGRFITIEYTRGNKEKANKYFSSVFYSNLALASVIIIFATVCVIWLEYFINIPDTLLFDVKVLFCLLAFNNVISLVCGTWGVATFIKNRLELSSIRTIIGNLINALLLMLLFTLLNPHIWYVGIAGTVMTIYTAVANYQLSKRLTPELKVRRDCFDLSLIKELVSSGIWNVLNKMSDILGYGLDLLVANLFLGATFMGVFAITKNVPFLILSLFQMIAAVFAPMLTQLYAQNNKKELADELNKSIRILGFFATIPLTCLFVWGDDFYSLWIPSQDAKLLQLITILGTMEYVVSMPLESLWNIFTITNKLKYSSLTLLGSCTLIILITIITMLLTESQMVRLLVLASSRSIVYMIRSLTFLPLYGAHCLGYPKAIFYKPLMKSIICTILSVVVIYLFSMFWNADTWMRLIFAGIISIIICTIINMFVILEKTDRILIISKIIKK